MELKDIAQVCYGNLYDRYFSDHKNDSCDEVLLINKNAIKDDVLDVKNPSNTTTYWIKKNINKQKLIFTKKDDILIQTKPIKVALIKNETGYIVTNQFILVRCNDNDDSEYIFNLLNNDYVIEYLNKASNSKNSTISIDALRSMPISIKYKNELKELLELIAKQDELHKMQNQNIINIFMDKAKEE